MFSPLTSFQEDVYQTLLQNPDVEFISKKNFPCDCGSGMDRGKCSYMVSTVESRLCLADCPPNEIQNSKFRTTTTTVYALLTKNTIALKKVNCGKFYKCSKVISLVRNWVTIVYLELDTKTLNIKSSGCNF